MEIIILYDIIIQICNKHYPLPERQEREKDLFFLVLKVSTGLNAQAWGERNPFCPPVLSAS